MNMHQENAILELYKAFKASADATLPLDLELAINGVISVFGEEQILEWDAIFKRIKHNPEEF